MKAEDRVVKTTEENCHNTLEERLSEQDRISFKAGMREGIRRAYESMVNRGYIAYYDLDKAVEYLEKNGGYNEKDVLGMSILSH